LFWWVDLFSESGAPAVLLPSVNPTTPPTSTPAEDAPLDGERAFGVFAARVGPRVLCWLGWSRVPVADRDDLLQEILLVAWQRRARFNPKRGRYEDWTYAISLGKVRDYRKRAGRRYRREELAPGDLPDIAAQTQNPEERFMLRRLLYQCLEEIPVDLGAILLAVEVDGRRMEVIAEAHDISLSTAYAHYQDARQRLQRALDRALSQQRSAGVAVLPITLDQLFRSERPLGDAPPETMARVRRALDRAMAADGAGEGSESGPRSRRPRALRALFGPRALPALTFVAGAASTYALMRDRGHEDAPPPSSAPAVALAAVADEPAEDADPAPPDSAVVAAGAAPVSSVGASPDPGQRRVVPPDEQTMLDKAGDAYRAHDWSTAIDKYREHERTFPRSRYSAARDRFLTLVLIAAGRAPEARQHVEAVRRANPDNPVLKELDAALSDSH
jgi:RNA polymerase sigma-70 factor (ECF subfamily)